MNIANNPEKFGLTEVGYIDVSEPYQFDTLIVWMNAQNRLFWYRDAGCSCPTPFEDVGLNDLHPINRWTFNQFESEVKGMYQDNSDYADSVGEGLALLQKVWRMIR